VSLVYISLLLLVAATPILLFFDNLIIGGAIELYVAIALAVIAIRMRPGEARHLLKLIRLPMMLAAFPLVWMLIQLLPLPIGGLSRSIWESAAQALNTPLSASISIDPGMTILALGHYASIIGAAFIAAAISVERQNAEKLLSMLCTAAVLISLIPVAYAVGRLTVLDDATATRLHPSIMTACAIGIVLFSASAVMVIERYEQRRHRHQFLSQFLIPIGIRLCGFLVCALTLISSDMDDAIFAAACGLAFIVIIYFVRMIGLGSRTAFAIVCVAIIATVTIVWTNGSPEVGAMLWRYMIGTNSEAASFYGRAVNEAGLAGTGGGTFGAISILYGTQGPLNVLHPPTFAAQIAIELGRPMLWVIIGLGCAVIASCAQSVFNRGRDFFYPLAGAGVSVAMILSSFSNAGVANPAISLLVAVTLGAAFAQSVRRTQ
jgi:hypothetical protein